MRLSTVPRFSGSADRKVSVSRTVRMENCRNYNDLPWGGTMNDKSWPQCLRAAPCHRPGTGSEPARPGPLRHQPAAPLQCRAHLSMTGTRSANLSER